MSVPQPTNAYQYGDCTDYVARVFPGIAQNLGNANMWLANAQLKGYPVLSQPVPNSVVVYGGGGNYSPLGHVAVVNSVNSDGSFNVSEMNYGAQNWNRVTNRTSTMTGVLGFIVPPGSNAIYSASQLASAGQSATTGVPITQFQLWPTGPQINFDPIIGGVVMVAGGALLVIAALSLIAIAVARTRIGRAAGATAATVAGPAGAVVSRMQAAAPAPRAKPVAPKVDNTPTMNAQASASRVARARARVVPSEERESVEREALRREQATTGVKPKPGAAIRAGEMAA